MFKIQRRIAIQDLWLKCASEPYKSQDLIGYSYFNYI